MMLQTLLLTVVLFTSADEAVLDRGREHCDLFYRGEFATLWERFSPEMQGALGSQDQLKSFREQLDAQLGEEIGIVEETTTDTGGVQVYLRTARFKKIEQPIQVQWAFDAEGGVAGFFIRPVQTEAPSAFLDYQTKTDLRLPFEEAWFVVWGGRSLAQNYHASTVDQRFAYDILIVKDESTHTGDGKRNEDYHCFGKKVFAPGAGVVAASANDVEDNEPGVMNPRQALGNHVIIDHGNGEYSFLAHFRKGTVKVTAGQEVKAGQLLGECGNSGNTTEAHIHYHLQDSPTFQQGKGLPAQFRSYIAGGEPVDRGEPVKGQVVQPAK